MKLLLFDIDGTLIRSQGAGRLALAAALNDLFGTAGPLENYRMDGKTDSRIVMDLMTAAGFEPEIVEQRLPDVLALMTKKARESFPTSGMIACPGVQPLLAALKGHNDVVLGLLTGNSASTAPLKLEAAGIDPHTFRIGAYGSDSADRNELPSIAMDRASRLTDWQFTGKNTAIIGDTPADILCARAGRATAVAVASGWHSSGTLAEYRPDYLLENLADTASVLSILLGFSNDDQPAGSRNSI